MKFYNVDIDEALEKTDTSKEGITFEEAKKRLEKDGPNKLKDAKKDSKIVMFLGQFKNLMIVVLFMAAIVSFIIAYQNGESYLDSIIILLIVFINAFLGFLEELKADQAISALKKMQTTKVRVKRQREVLYINSEDLVRGDIVLLEAGDRVAADARLIEVHSLKVDEAALTGESDAVVKDVKVIDKEVTLHERSNMVFAGTNVVYGKGQCVVVATGMNTEIGLIAESLGNTKVELTPLQKKINGISKVLTIIISIVILAMFIVCRLKDMPLTEALLLANKMELKELYFNHTTYDSNYKMEENMFYYNLALNNDVSLNEDTFLGDPMEVAVLNYLKKTTDPMVIKEKYPRINEIPFDSERKMMSVMCPINGENYLFTKGSFDSVISLCTKIEMNGEIKDLTPLLKQELMEAEQAKSNQALRLLAYAYKKMDNENIMESDLVFQGLIGVIDPPRSDVKEAISLCKRAHIIPVMITGDSLNTAKAIAREVGILNDDSEAISGKELDKLSEEELYQNVLKYRVYARVSPMNKLNIVNAWKKHGKVVAMTGDGVNDAPAIKASDIGIGMGITGTEVSKSVADIVLVDDSFSTIVTAVKEGRRIFDNIRNVITYLLIGNITEVITVFVGLIFGYTIFFPIQLLFINLITDSIPAIALAFEDASEDIMNREVRKKDSSFFTPFLISKILVSSILKSIAILFVYFLNNYLFGVEVAGTTAFLCLMILELCFAYSCKNVKKPVVNKMIFDNSKLNYCILGLMVVAAFIFLTPLKSIFGLTSITFMQFLYCIVIIIVMVVIDELLKVRLSRIFKD